MSIVYTNGGYVLGTGVGGTGGSIGPTVTTTTNTTPISISQAMSQQAIAQQAVLQQNYQAAQAFPSNIALTTFDKDDAAWDASISTLVDVWLAKYGSEWVNEAELVGADNKFFAIAATRLLKLNRLEKINVPTSMYAVYRIVE